MESRREKLVQFIEANCVVRKEGIKLASGRTTNFYLDCRVALMSPRALPLIAEMVLEKLEGLSEKPIAIGGAIAGAVPITAGVVLLSSRVGHVPLSGFMVRKDVKDHGLQKKIENPPAAGSPVAIVEDVVTSGGSTIRAIDAAEEAGLKVVAVVPVVDRGEGGAEAIRKRVPRAVYAPLIRLEEIQGMEPTIGP